MDDNFAHREEKFQEMGTIYMALDAVTKYVAEWLDRNLKTLDSDYWNRYVMTVLSQFQQETIKANGAKTIFELDQPTIMSVFLHNKSVLMSELGVDPQLFGYAHSIKDIRNKYFHKSSKPLPQKRFEHDVETIVLFLEGLGAGQEILEGIRSGGRIEEKSVPEKTETVMPIKIEKPVEKPERLVEVPLRRAVFTVNHKGTPVVTMYHNGRKFEFYPAEGAKFPDGLVNGCRFDGVASIREADGVKVSQDKRFFTAFFVKMTVVVSSGTKVVPCDGASGTAPQPLVEKSDATANSVSEKRGKPFDTKHYPQLVQDRLNARQIVGFSVETLFGQDAENFYRECKATECGYELVSVHFAILARQSQQSKDLLNDVKAILDRGFVGLISDFQKAIVNPAQDSLVWFFGSKERIEPSIETEPIESVAPSPASVVTLIPKWFEQAICADGLPYLSVDEVQMTLELSKRDVDRYAKTYSPRSFAEGIKVGKNLPKDFLQRVSKAGRFTMLDVGCGTAGFSLGMIHGLDRIISKASACSAKLDLIDGNPQMLAKARKFAEAREMARAYGVSSMECDFIEKQISKVVDCFPKPSYDLIVTSKFLGELVCRGMRDVFTAFLKEASRHLSSGGLIVLVDIPKHREQIEAAVKGLGKVPVWDEEVHPAFAGSDSKDSENVVVVLLNK